ncbi:chromophore lyase CRL, chloroplastic isoform X4 [Phoenix dactylifera]|uniref:Chromophore lyase CRL, chloroplastic isoform X4 n=1 Tax=Phoenix dactylifera TaxID=42345 RepID=A0A8B7C3N8_PHODC|nr:chromophore lyase CRL, chloroplastic isoform X4 [Phoenix dactylifera]
MGTDSDSGGGGGRARGWVLKALVLFGGALLLKRLRKSTTRWDHARAVAEALSGEKFSREQARRDPDNYFNIRMLMCPATEMVDDSRVLYFEQAFWRTPQKPFRQRFYMVKPCPKEKKCDVEDIAEHLTTVHLSRCERGKRCLYEGSSPPGGFPNSWNGATYCTSELAIHKYGEVHTWDRGYDDEGNQVWGARGGPYEFKPAPSSSDDDMFSPLNFAPTLSLEKKMEGSFVVDEQ